MTASSTRTSRADDYAAAVAALTSRGRFGISLGLERVEAILDELGHPERSLRGALVGGTNGKGSVVAMARSVLAAAGLRVGTMPKPHLVSYRERIADRRAAAGRGALRAAVARVLPAVDRVAARLGPPTEFEALTAAAFAELAASEVDLVLVEVGMGGRLDATNVLDAGVAAITNVQLDHERYLGHTLAAIGTEKAAIIKPGNLAVTGATGRGLRPIAERARQLACAACAWPGRGGRIAPPLREAGWDGLVHRRCARPKACCATLHVGLLGSHQAGNAAVALALLDALRAGRRAPGHCRSTGSTEATIRAAACATRAGRAGWSCCATRPAATCCSTVRTTPPAPAPSPGRLASWACGASRSCSAPCAASGSPDMLRALAALEPRADLHRGRRSGRALATGRCSMRGRRQGGGRGRRRRRPQAGAGAGSRAAPLSGPADRGGRLALPGRCGACHARSARRRHDRAALGRADLRDGHHQHHARLVQRRRPGAAPGATSTRSSAAAVEQARGFVEAGADILDVGAESSRPAQFYGEHPPMSAAAGGRRWPCRWWPRWRGEFGDRALVSIDTIKGEVARQALAAGADHGQRRMGRAARPRPP